MHFPAFHQPNHEACQECCQQRYTEPSPNRRVAMADERVARHHARLETKALFCMGQEAVELAERREAQLGAVESDAPNASVSTNAWIEQDRKDMREVSVAFSATLEPK